MTSIGRRVTDAARIRHWTATPRGATGSAAEVEFANLAAGKAVVPAVQELGRWTGDRPRYAEPAPQRDCRPCRDDLGQEGGCGASRSCGPLVPDRCVLPPRGPGEDGARGAELSPRPAPRAYWRLRETKAATETSPVAVRVLGGGRMPRQRLPVGWSSCHMPPYATPAGLRNSEARCPLPCNRRDGAHWSGELQVERRHRCQRALPS